MTGFLKAEGINGSATAKNYQHWSEIQGLHFTSSRHLPMEVGRVANRHGLPNFNHIVLSKEADASSADLFQALCNGKVIPTMKIDLCRTADALTPHLQYTMYNVMIATMDEHFVPTSGTTLETIELNYTKLEKRYMSRDASNKDTAPKSVAYNLETATE